MRARIGAVLRPVELAKKEFSLLRVLATDPRRVFTKARAPARRLRHRRRHRSSEGIAWCPLCKLACRRVKPSLSGPRAKIERAHEHLHVLDAETAAFYEGTPAEGKPYVVESEFRAESSEYVFTVKAVREPPLRLGIILGDFAHNLRSALDHLVCQLALLSGPTDCSTTQFPICFDPVRFNQLAGNWLKGVAPRHRAAIEQAQPYESREPEKHALTILDWVDRIDKHRAVHPPFGFFVDPGRAGAEALTFVPNTDAGTIRYRKIANGRRIEGEAEIAILKLAPLGLNPKVQMGGQLTFQPAFGERWLSGGALEPVAAYVSHFVESFALDFP